MNAEQLQAIKERVAKAIPGPWKVEESRFEGKYNAANIDENYDLPACLMDIQNAEFIAHAREDVPALVAEVERSQEEFERMKLSRNRWMESNSKNTLKIHTLQERLDRTELAEAKARMEIERLRDALEFYADADWYHLKHDNEIIILSDAGDKARQAMAGESND